jgi:hypothetical protein
LSQLRAFVDNEVLHTHRCYPVRFILRVSFLIIDQMSDLG